MSMIQASEAKVEWNAEKKHWQVVIQVGAEYIRRQCAKTPRGASEQQLRELAIRTAQDEGYGLDAAHVSIAQ
jgi:hypothetical protein